jgi:hypothetical protein
MNYMSIYSKNKLEQKVTTMLIETESATRQEPSGASRRRIKTAKNGDNLFGRLRF